MLTRYLYRILVMLLFATSGIFVCESYADFKILGGNILNQRSGPVNFDTDNDNVHEIIFAETGEVGIGTTVPTGNLHVEGNLQLDDYLSLFEISSAPSALSGNGLLYNLSGDLYFMDGNGSAAQLTESGNGPWALQGGNAYRTSGNIGIGTSDMDAKLTLHTSSNVLIGQVIKANQSHEVSLSEWRDSADNVLVKIQDRVTQSNAELLVVNPAKQLIQDALITVYGYQSATGIAAIQSHDPGAGTGLTSPVINMTGKYNNGGTIVNHSLNLSVSALGAASSRGHFHLYTSSDLVLYRNENRAAMVGVNQDTPSAQLHVVPNWSGKVGFRVEANSGQTSDLAQFLDSTAAAMSVITATGDLGIGTATPSANLHVNGNVVSGNIFPMSNTTYTLGSSTQVWNNVYAKDYTMLSDRRFKTKVADLEYGLDEVMKLRPVTFHWNSEPDKNRKVGLIAQEVEAVMSETVNAGDTPQEPKGIYYSDLVPVLIKAMQEQESNSKREMRELRKLLEKQSRKIEALERKLEN